MTYCVRVIQGVWVRCLVSETKTMTKLVSVRPSPVAGKKLRAVFDDGKSVDFGDAKYEDYRIHKDLKRKAQYIARHEKSEDWNNPQTAGALSRWILWNKPTLTESITDFRKRFNL